MKYEYPITLHRNGDPIRFVVTIDPQRLCERLGPKAEGNVSNVAVVGGGAVKVRHIP